MKLVNPNLTGKETRRRSYFPLLAAVAFVLILMFALLLPRPNEVSSAPGMDRAGSQKTRLLETSGGANASVLRRGWKPATPESASEIVARRLKLFAKQQRAVVHRLAERYKLAVPPEVEKFFAALDAGDWPEAQRIYKLLRDGDYDGAPHDADLKKYWRAILEAYGAAEQAQLWPPQQFLDYGNRILDSLPPGMVYVGGTDAGCFICTMLNATSDGQQHTTLTQNALADPSYLEYLRATSDGSINFPTSEQLQAAYAQYLQDAQSRHQHDLQYPDEPKQLLPGEASVFTGEKPAVEGLVAVMNIDGILLHDIVQMNPGISFGMEESYPLASTYTGAAPLGPIYALNVNGDSQSAITPDAASQAVNYWQNLAQTLASTPETASSQTAMNAYAHDAAAQGNMLANNNFPVQAAQDYQTALTLSPACLDAAEGLAKVQASQGDFSAANQTLDTFAQNNPKQTQAIASFRSSITRQ
jgi:hypothetical protein